MRILVADDDAVCRTQLGGVLKHWGYDVVSAESGEEAWRVLQEEGAPRLAILDWMMPGIDGIEICRRLRRRQKDPYTYVILVTAKESKEDAILGLDAGADDYLVKPVDPSEMKVRLRAGLRILDLQEFLLASRESLREQATHDSMTGLANRAEVERVLNLELARSERMGSRLGVLIVDVDHFKPINDSYGHLVGDAALREIAQRLGRSVRPYDCVGRFGGDEFLVVLPGCGLASTATIGERMRAACSGRPLESAAGPIPLSISVGGTTRSATHETLQEILSIADAALYSAKRKGRDRVVTLRDLPVDERSPQPGGPEVAGPENPRTLLDPIVEVWPGGRL